jgi:hypothetical protein
MEETGSTPSSIMTSKEFSAAREQLEKFTSGEQTVVCFTGVEHCEGRVHLLVQPLETDFLEHVFEKLQELFSHVPGVRIHPFHDYSYIVQVPVTT